MKFYKRLGIYKASNVEFNPDTLSAYSYNWWRFVAKVDGKVVFNNYRYSASTSKHQSKVRALLNELGIKIDYYMPIPKGIQIGQTLEELILIAEEYLCDEISREVIKQQERSQRAKVKRHTKKLEDYLENQVHFRYYEIKDVSQFGQLNIIGVHQVVDLKTLENDVENALYTFQRDGFSQVIFYVGGQS